MVIPKRRCSDTWSIFAPFRTRWCGKGDDWCFCLVAIVLDSVLIGLMTVWLMLHQLDTWSKLSCILLLICRISFRCIPLSKYDLRNGRKHEFLRLMVCLFSRIFLFPSFDMYLPSSETERWDDKWVLSTILFVCGNHVEDSNTYIQLFMVLLMILPQTESDYWKHLQLDSSGRRQK